MAPGLYSFLVGEVEHRDWAMAAAAAKPLAGASVRLIRFVFPLVANIPVGALTAQCTVGGGAPVTLGYLIDDYLLHLRHHIDQILRRDPVTQYPRA